MFRMKLTDIIKEYLIEEGRETPHKVRAYTQFGIQALRDLHTDVSGALMTAKLTLDSSLRAQLPIDFVNPLRIYILDGGRKWSISEDRLMGIDCDLQDYDKGRYYTGTLSGAVMGNSLGHYSIDKELGTVDFSSNVSTSDIYIDYISNPKLVDGDFWVHPSLETPIKNYIYWKKIHRKSNIPRAEKEYAKKEYYDSKQAARVNMRPLTKERLIANSRKNTYPTI